ncbi:hypothetical protein LZZ85_24375 [Terrimonas sp. NA20]|uniref:Uncharacterized protein n=1 Tax=Terrimonas ginsenosidimutans TaxID=2908004 RepID=A0ABS9KYM7_9BACT|nr:hypothetical protein [Terrimonas ginsenosidimutans]MCG2617457.1 hypothetical protein [Terrimonas ginsenosidimutans]
MTNTKIAARQFTESPVLFTAYLPLKQHSEPEDGAIEEEGSLEDYVLSEDLDWEEEE